MRRLICFLCIILLLPVVSALSAEPDAVLTGPDTVLNQESFLLELQLDGTALSQVQFSFACDSENLIFMGAEETGLWEYHMDLNRFTLRFAGDGAAAEKQTVIKLLFQLRNVPVGTQFWVKLTDMVVTAGGTDISLGTISWENTCAKPISTDNHLSALRISDGVLSPDFSPSKQNYTAQVSYHIASVEVIAQARDPNAQVFINNPELTPADVTNITVTVMAEDGSERVYTIAVTREEDPNRPLSSENRLSDIVVRGFYLSPEFQTNVTSYVLWLPYEITSVDIGGLPMDSRATVKVEGNTRLKAGQDNEISIICTAEDGSQRVYTVIAKRAPAHETEATDPPSEPATEPTQTAPQGTVISSAEPRESQPVVTEPAGQVSDGMDMDIPSWVYVVIAVAGITGSAAAGMLISERKRKS